MNLEQTRAFLKALGAKNIQSKPDGKWLKCSCPLAPWTHQNYKDTHPSFAMTVDEHEEPFFNCFTCMHGSAAQLIQTLELYWCGEPKGWGPPDTKKAREIIEGAKLIPYDLAGYKEFTPGAHKAVVPWPDIYLQSFMKAEHVPLASEYLFGEKSLINQFGQKCRGFPHIIAGMFDIRYDNSKGMVVFPYRDAYGRFAGMRGRSIVKKSHYDYTFNGVNNASLVWYNEPVLDRSTGWVVVVEGQMDVMRVALAYPKVVGNLTAKPTVYKLNKLLQAGGTILIPDNDKAGQESIDIYKEHHRKYQHPLRILNLPDSVKDPDDCHPSYLLDRILELVS